MDQVYAITSPQVHFGLSWDINAQEGHDFDLDASCVALDATGNLVDMCYYAKLQACNGGVVHSGDNRNGDGDGDDERISVHFDLIEPRVAALCLVVTSYNGDPFSSVETATVRALDVLHAEIFNLSVGCCGKHTGLVALRLFRVMDNGVPSWRMVWNPQTCEGRTFLDLVPKMQESLQPYIPTMRVTPPPSVPIVRKGELKRIDPNLKAVYLGLGWDPIGDGVDLDANCMFVDAFGSIINDTVFFGRTKNRNGSVQHSGDNLDGSGDGDDEVIKAYLRSIPPDVFAMVFCITVYTENITFARIKSAYVRLLDDRKRELLRYPLIECGRSTAMIMCMLHRTRDGWSLVALGEPADGRLHVDLTEPVLRIVKPVLSRTRVDEISFRSEPLPRSASHTVLRTDTAAGSGGCCVVL